MADSIHVSIITPDGTSISRLAEFVSIPTPDGPTGILRGHAKMVCAVSAGVLRIKSSAGEEKLSLGGGVARVGGNEVTVIVSSAEE